ncbi:DUF3558 domain-containing protein [Amycolatopsis sp. cmx-4-68]|uniref:DUF3558 domain-containing protein n=1 Tax=Amycolatopsis sp. cmx-4-68 TaxID=2790938 RepID=UPI00397A1491
MRLSARVAAGAVVPVLLLAGCSPEKAGTASPAPSSPASSGASSNPDVPKVATPLDAAKYETKPCDIVPASTLASLRFTDPGTVQQKDDGIGAAGPSCGWKIHGEGVSMLVIVATGNRDRGVGGLAGLYGAHDRGELPFLEPAPEVEGYPAIYIDLRDRRASGHCSMSVGVADDLAIAVDSGGYQGQQDSCAAAQQVAAAIITTLKGA